MSLLDYSYLTSTNSGFQVAAWNDRSFVICDLEIVWKLEIENWKLKIGLK